MTLEKLFASEDLSDISYVPKYFVRYDIIHKEFLRGLHNFSHFDKLKFESIEWGKIIIRVF